MHPLVCQAPNVAQLHFFEGACLRECDEASVGDVTDADQPDCPEKRAVASQAVQGLGGLPSFEEVKEPVVALGSLIALPFVSLADCAMRKPETKQWQGKSNGGTEQLDSGVSTAVELIPKAKEAEKIEAEVIGPYPVVAETVTTPIAVMAN